MEQKFAVEKVLQRVLRSPQAALHHLTSSPSSHLPAVARNTSASIHAASPHPSLHLLEALHLPLFWMNADARDKTLEWVAHSGAYYFLKYCSQSRIMWYLRVHRNLIVITGHRDMQATSKSTKNVKSKYLWKATSHWAVSCKSDVINHSFLAPLWQFFCGMLSVQWKKGPGRYTLASCISAVAL